jgi:alkylation response protein AidB-like acyl-CoA dehydrogenase
LLYRLSFTGAAPYTLCSVPLGIAAGALDEFVIMARSKMAAQPGGPPRPMSELEHVHLSIAGASVAIDAASELILRDTQAMDSELRRGRLPTHDERILYRRNQSYAAVQAAHATNVLFEALGANGGDLATPIQRAWRDAHVIARHMSLAWPTTGAMYGQNALGLKPRGTY